MPFGLAFGAVYFVIVSVWLGLGFLRIPYGPARATGALLLLLGPALAGGLLLRRVWARWAGVGSAVVLSGFSLLFVAQTGAIVHYVMVLISLASLAFLLVPTTGDPRLGVGADVPLDPGKEALARVLGWITAACLAGFGLVAAWAWFGPPPQDPRAAEARARWSEGRVQWADFGPGLERARQESKPMLVDFYAEWCGPCKEMDRGTFRDPQVVELMSNVIPVRIDAEETEPREGYVGVELAGRYNVQSYPTVALIDANGDVIARRSGYQNALQFTGWLGDALQLARPAVQSDDS